MKKLLYSAVFLIATATLSAQQFPFMEGYNVNPYSLSPAYAGMKTNKTVFIDYRTDWMGIDGGPVTYQLSYSDELNEKVGLGGRFIYDKTDIFKQTLILGTYTYEVNIYDDHYLNFGLSAGFFRNSIDLTKYYNDPGYVQDIVLIYGQDKSKLKFVSDLSAIYRYSEFEAGILFSNVMFGSAKYQNTEITYKPLKNFLVHASYLFKLDDRWDVKPTLILRGGQNIPVQLEASPAITWNDRFWGTALFRTGGIFGVGLGGEVYPGVLLNYSYNISTSVALNTFGSHQFTLGIRLSSFKGK